MKTFFDNAFYSLKNRNYRLYFVAQFISLAGSWMQSVALGWLAYEMTGSGAQLGIILGLSTFPLLIFGLVGGYVGQRYENYKILVYTQYLYGIVPLIVAVLIFLDKLSIEVLYFSALWIGVMRIIDQPVRQSFMKTVVGKENLQNASSLFASISALSRIVGPLLAAFFMQNFGAAICFFINGFSFFYMSYVIGKMDKEKFYINSELVKEKNILASLKYIYKNKIVFSMLFLGAMLGTFVYVFQTIFPIYAKTVFQGNVLSYSIMITVFSIGAILGGVYGAGSKEINLKKLRFLGILLSIFYFTQALPHSIEFFLLSLFFVGFLLIQFSTIVSTILKTNCDDKHLNVATALWSMGIMGMTSVGSFLAGTLSDIYGVQTVTIFYAFCILFAVLYGTRKV